jgi:histidine triad (HIT) family protein
VSFELPNAGAENCVFCSIISGDSEASWEAKPGAGSVVCFHNRLNWVRVMLLVVPTQHMTQQEFWASSALREAAEMAVDMGDEHCGHEGYRVIANFGLQAHQSVEHAHLHVISGPSRMIENGVGQSRLNLSSDLIVDEFEVDETPFAARISPAGPLSQRDMWKSDRIMEAASSAREVARRYSPNGFRLMSSFDPSAEGSKPGSNASGLFLLGGGQLGLYGSAY